MKIDKWTKDRKNEWNSTLFNNVVNANRGDFSWKNKLKNQTNWKRRIKKKKKKKKSWSYTFAQEIFSVNCIHMLVQKVILPMHEWQEEEGTKKTWDASQRPFTCACSMDKKDTRWSMLNLSPHTGTLLDNYTSRNLKLKIHDCDLSY